jgi:hypothetical protein
MELNMARNKFGQYEKGTCGNPRGRPRKTPPDISDGKLRQDFFEAAETLIPIVENGKRKLIPARVAIDQQLIRKAVSGNMTAIREYNKRHERFILEHVKFQLEYLRLIDNAEQNIRKYPEDVTDEYKAMLNELKLRMDQSYRIH